MKNGLIVSIIISFVMILFLGACGGSDTATDNSKTVDRNGDAGDSGWDNIGGNGDITGGGASGYDCNPSLPCPSSEQCDYVNQSTGKCVTAGTAQHPEPWSSGGGDTGGSTTDSGGGEGEGETDGGGSTTDSGGGEGEGETDGGGGNDVGPKDTGPVDPCKDVITECLSASTVRRCKSDGSGPEEVDCSLVGQSCYEGQCVICQPNEIKCLSGKELGQCDSTGQAWAATPCGDMKRCDDTSLSCVDAVCNPSSMACKDDTTIEKCNDLGTELTTETCETGKYCQADAQFGVNCVDLCSAAAALNSYFGCEYWAVNLSNSQLADKFHDQYALVIGNTHPRLTANVKVLKTGNVIVKQDTVTPGTTKVIYLDWNAASVVASMTYKAQSTLTNTAYKVLSDIPVTVYQFNPLRSAVDNPSSSSDYTYTNDATLLLPAHIYSNSYVGIGYPHMSVTQLLTEGHMPGYLAVVATSPGSTQVQVTFRGYSAAGASGTNVKAHNPGTTDTFTLQQYQVLQIATTNGGNSSSGTCNGSTCKVYPEADLTGTLLKSNQPIAVFGGNDCSFVPYNKWACDHMEEQLFPFSRWGNKYLATRSKPIGNGQGTDLWRIVAGVDGTQVNITPAPQGITVPFPLNAGQRREFYGDGDYLIETQDKDHPILVAQFLSGQDASQAKVGDPSMILAAPVEQYRVDYLFLTPDTIAEDYANIIRPKGTKVLLNNVEVPTASFTAIGTTGYEVARGVQLPDGQSSLQADMPVGLVVYGFDSYVSYGYLGGLDLKSITQVQPGG